MKHRQQSRFRILQLIALSICPYLQSCSESDPVDERARTWMEWSDQELLESIGTSVRLQLDPNTSWSCIEDPGETMCPTESEQFPPQEGGYLTLRLNPSLEVERCLRHVCQRAHVYKGREQLILNFEANEQSGASSLALTKSPEGVWTGLYVMPHQRNDNGVLATHRWQAEVQLHRDEAGAHGEGILSAWSDEQILASIGAKRELRVPETKSWSCVPNTGFFDCKRSLHHPPSKDAGYLELRLEHGLRARLCLRGLCEDAIIKRWSRQLTFTVPYQEGGPFRKDTLSLYLGPEQRWMGSYEITHSGVDGDVLFFNRWRGDVE